MSKERPWVNRSFFKWQKCGHEWFAHVAHDKRANEQIALFFEQIAHSLFWSQKASYLLKKMWRKWYFFCTFKKTSDSLIPSFLISDVSESLRSLTKNEPCEQIAQGTHQKRATMSDLLRLLTKNEQSEQIAQVVHQKLATMSNLLRSLNKNEQIAHFLKKWMIRSFFSWKMSY